MTNAIGSVSDLVRVIQAQFAQQAAPSVRAKPGPRKAGGSASSTPGQLAALIELRVRQLERADPERGRKAFRLFLETVLLAQFGEDLVNDPKFYLLVDDVHAAMERDERLRDMMSSAIRHLLSNA